MQVIPIPDSKIAEEINRLNDLARTHANQAIDYAKQAGELLIKVRDVLEHGQWMSWVSENLTVSHRQALRYIDAAQGKKVPMRHLAAKLDTMSNSPSTQRDLGTWKDGSWRPNSGYVYLFNEDDAVYWVQPSKESGLWFHVCKHYSGQRMPTENFTRQHTIFAPLNDPDLTNNQYVGTTLALGWVGVEEVLKSYGLRNIQESLRFSVKNEEGVSRPFGEPDPSTFYEDWHEIEELRR